MPFPTFLLFGFSSLQDLGHIGAEETLLPFLSSVLCQLLTKSFASPSMWSPCIKKGICGVSLPTLHLFLGLSLSEAKKLSSYFHFREPVELKNKTLLEKAALDPSLDFMDSLEHDIPKGNSLLL